MKDMIHNNQQVTINPKLEVVLPVLKKWAEKCVTAIDKNYSAKLDFGKKINEHEKYHAIVVEKDGKQLGFIPIRQNKEGVLTHNVQIPMCEGWKQDLELRMDNCFTLIRKGLESIVGEHIVVSSMVERAELERKVAELKAQELEQLMNLKVQVQKYNNWMPMSQLNCDKFEDWKLSFEHDFNIDNQPIIRLKAYRGEGVEREDIELGSAYLNPDNLQDRIVIKGNDDNFPEITESLIRSGKIRLVNQYTERYQDYPGADEIEDFHFKRMDVTDLYQNFLKLRNSQYLFSPITDVQEVENDTGYSYLNNWISAKLAGILELSERCNNQEQMIVKCYKDKPLYNFLLQDIAHRKFAAEINHLKESMTRLTDVNISFKGPHVRCKIDGEQQMALSVGRELLDKCRETPDTELAIHQVAALLYSQELTETQAQSNGMKR